MGKPHPVFSFFDLAVPFFLPLWRRVLTVVIPILWAGVEYLNGNTGWAVLFCVMGLFAMWRFAAADWAAVAAQARRKDKAD